MQLIHNILSFNQILTVSLLGWLVAQVLKTIINFILLGKFQLERMWGDGGMPSAHSATVCAMVIATGRCVGVDSAIFAVASVVAIITMHDAMGVRHETGRAGQGPEPDDRSVDRSEREECSFPAEHASEGDGRPYAAAGRGRRTGRRSRRLPVSAGLRHSFFTQERTAETENLHLKDV